MRAFLLIVIFLLFKSYLFAQNKNYFAFERDFNIIVFNEKNEILENAWMGGLNSIQIFELDINLDGLNDLIIFEKSGNKIFPLIFDEKLASTNFPYRFEPSFTEYFPRNIKDWIIFVDYNHDGKKDIFTYSNGGIKVFKNVSEKQLMFKEVIPLILSKQFDNYVNIFLTNADVPIIDDIDQDGDVDILTFGVLGTFVEWHKNVGVEKFNKKDTLVFERVDRCWGNFAEHESSNQIILNADCPFDKKSNAKHVGSTLFCFDANGDKLPDLLIGDVDYPNLLFLENGGTLTNANFIKFNYNYLEQHEKYKLFSMPVVSYVDFDRDGQKELICSPFDPGLYVNETKKSVWLYRNVSTNDTLKFKLEQIDFLQNQMIDVGTASVPILHDIDKDGDADLLIANYGSLDSTWYENGFLSTRYVSTISVYENIDSCQSNQCFKHITSDFANLSKLKMQALFPTFGDIDDDGLLECLIGNAAGKIMLLKQKDYQNKFDFRIVDTAFINTNSTFVTPQLFDLNEDGLLDLIVGQKNGEFLYYQNQGSKKKPEFILQTSKLSNISTVDLTYSYHGYSTPCLFKDTTNNIHLFSGSNRGYLLHYKKIKESTDFVFVDTIRFIINHSVKSIYEGIRTSLAVSDLNNDGYIDLIVGNFTGGLSLFKGVDLKNLDIRKYESFNENLIIYPNPTKDFVSIEFNDNIDWAFIQIFDIQSRLIIERTIKDAKKLEFDLASIESSFYIIKVTTSSGTITRKLLLVK